MNAVHVAIFYFENHMISVHFKYMKISKKFKLTISITIYKEIFQQNIIVLRGRRTLFTIYCKNLKIDIAFMVKF